MTATRQDQVAAVKRSRGRPRRDEAEHIESELLDAALKEFLRSGYGGASMTQIVKTLGISKTTLYSRYPTKADLFRAIVSRQIEARSAESFLRTGADTFELGMGLRAYANRALEMSLEGEILQVNRLIFSESPRFPELGTAAVARNRQGVRQIAAFIAACAERDGVPCRDPHGVAEAFIAMLRGWYVDVLLANEQVAPADRELWVERAVQTLVSGRADW